MMRAFPGHLTPGTCPSTPRKPSSWHDYAFDAAMKKTGNKPNTSTPYSYWLSPGFERTSETGARLARDFLRWTGDVQDMVASKADWQLLPFNQWAEGAATESAAQWSSPSGHGFYLDTLHSDGVPMNKIVVSAGDIACAQGTVPEPPPGGVVALPPDGGIGHLRADAARRRARPASRPHGGPVPRGQPVRVWCPVGVRDPVPQQLGPGARPHQAEHRQPRVQGFAKNPECGGLQATGHFQYFGAAAGEQPNGWYGYDLGPDWHFIVAELGLQARWPTRPRSPAPPRTATPGSRDTSRASAATWTRNA